MTEVSHKMTMPGYGVFLPNMYCEEPMQIVDQKLAATLRYLRMRGGIVAVLGSKAWTKRKATSNTPVRINNAMIRLLLHWRLSTHRKVEMIVWVTHGIRLATPLKCQYKTDHTRYQECSARSIKLRQLLRPGELERISVRDLEEEVNGDHRRATKRQIDIEAPSPRYI